MCSDGLSTDTNLLWDTLRKIIQISAQLCQAHDLTEWRQSHHHLRSIKKNYRLIQTLKHSTSKDEAKREACGYLCPEIDEDAPIWPISAVQREQPRT